MRSILALKAEWQLNLYVQNFNILTWTTTKTTNNKIHMSEISIPALSRMATTSPVPFDISGPDQ